MKKMVICGLFFVLAVSAFGQQFLWSTVQGNDTRYVPLNNVTREVLTFCDQYDRYYDFTGFSKERFVENFDYGFGEWEWLNDIEDLTVFAVKSNSGRGSVVLVMCVSKNNVNTIIFTNHMELELGTNYSFTYDKNKFSNWFRTLLN